MSLANQTVSESEVFEGEIHEETGIVRGVKLLGLRSRNRRNYDTDGVRKTASVLLSGARVYIDHPESPEKNRSYRDAFGVIENVEYRPGHGHFGNLKYNPNHPMAAQFVWDVKNNPKSLGMSINSRIKPGKTDKDGDVVVESLELVRSVDVVTKPATTDGIFEAVVEEDEAMDMKILREKHPDLVKQILEETKLEIAESEETKALRKSLAEAQESLKKLADDAAAKQLRDSVESEFSKLFESLESIESIADVRKEVIECACQMAEEPRKSFRKAVESLTKLIPSSEVDDEDDDTKPADEEEHEEKPSRTTYRPGASKSKSFDLASHLGISKKS